MLNIKIKHLSSMVVGMIPQVGNNWPIVVKQADVLAGH
jgi:hypothetical protein